MLRTYLSSPLLVCALALVAVPSAQADLIYIETDTLGQILTNYTGGIDDNTNSTRMSTASVFSNPAVFVRDSIGSNYVVQFRLNDLPDVNDILSVKFKVFVEGNSDPDRRFGIGFGAANADIAVGDKMSPGSVTTYDFNALDIDDSFALDIKSAIIGAVNNKAEYFRVAMTANPLTEYFDSVSFFDPHLEVQMVPEPSTLACLGLGVALVGASRLRRRLK